MTDRTIPTWPPTAADVTLAARRVLAAEATLDVDQLDDAGLAPYREAARAALAAVAPWIDELWHQAQQQDADLTALAQHQRATGPGVARPGDTVLLGGDDDAAGYDHEAISRTMPGVRIHIVRGVRGVVVYRPDPA